VALILLMLHLIGLSLALGGVVCQIALLARHQNSGDIVDRTGSERMAGTVITLILTPGVYLALVTGIGLLWKADWEPLSEGWLQFKLLFFFWIFLATRLMRRNARNIHALREQCGGADSDRLRSLKDNHQMIGYVTVLSFLFVIAFSLWKPF
jgi:uncharacterized membrane protein